MTLIEHAEAELRAAGFYDKDSDYNGMLAESVMQLIRVFAAQGHSGYSAARTAQLFATLASYKPLKPITGEADEWVHGHAGKDTYQNKRLSSVFKEGENGQPYYLDAIVWQGEEPHDTFTGMVENITSRQYIRLPFVPKTFYVHVVKEMYDPAKHDEKVDRVVEGNGKYVYRIKDRSELDEVFSYYDRYEYGNRGRSE